MQLRALPLTSANIEILMSVKQPEVKFYMHLCFCSHCASKTKKIPLSPFPEVFTVPILLCTSVSTARAQGLGFHSKRALEKQMGNRNVSITASFPLK